MFGWILFTSFLLLESLDYKFKFLALKIPSQVKNTATEKSEIFISEYRCRKSKEIGQWDIAGGYIA